MSAARHATPSARLPDPESTHGTQMPARIPDGRRAHRARVLGHGSRLDFGGCGRWGTGVGSIGRGLLVGYCGFGWCTSPGGPAEGLIVWERTNIVGVVSLRGFMYPRTPEGVASILASPPWHYSGDMLTVEYRTDPQRVAALLPAPLESVPDDPGAVALIWADWQSCSDSGEELLDPVRAQYKEVFLVVRCQYRGETYSRAAYIWVDKDFAMARGHFQGYPKKLADIAMTRPITVGRAGPRLAPGGRFGATLSTWGRRLAEARFTITDTSDTVGFVNSHPMLHSRQMPAIEADGEDSLDELVTMRGYDVEIGATFTGEAELDVFESPTEELHLLEPAEVIGAYYRQIGLSMARGTTLWAAHNPKANK